MKAIILKKNIFAEGNEIVTVYSRELGKIRGIARAVKSPASKLAFGLQQLFYSELELAQTRRNFTVTGAKPLNTFKNLRESLSAVNLALYAAEMILKSTADEQPNEQLFDYLLKFLEHLDAQPAASHLCWNFFGLHVLALTGYQIDPKACRVCGRSIAAVPSENIFFSSRKGGFICGECGHKTADAALIDRKIYEALSTLDPVNFEAQDQLLLPKKELQAAAKSFIEHILERDLKAARFVV